jgi:hypothetical protein
MYQRFSEQCVLPDRRSIPSTLAEEAAALVARYPELTRRELDRLLSIYPRIPTVEAALMISDDVLGPKLDLLFKHHHAELATPFRQYAALVAIAVAGILVVAWTVAFAS